MNITNLARHALECLLTRQPVILTHETGWKREGLPLPIKRMKPDADGYTRQSYRPLDIFEYAEDALSGELAKRLQRQEPRKAKSDETAGDAC